MLLESHSQAKVLASLSPLETRSRMFLQAQEYIYMFCNIKHAAVFNIAITHTIKDCKTKKQTIPKEIQSSVR